MNIMIAHNMASARCSRCRTVLNIPNAGLIAKLGLWEQALACCAVCASGVSALLGPPREPR